MIRQANTLKQKTFLMKNRIKNFFKLKNSNQPCVCPTCEQTYNTKPKYELIYPDG